MKKTAVILLIVGALLTIATSKVVAQMTLQVDYPNASNVGYIIGNNANNAPLQVVSLLLNGKKYVLQDMIDNQVRIYNLDYTLWKTINLPTISGCTPSTAYYISENLFKIDNKVDLAIGYEGTTNKQLIIDETGSIINTLDSAELIQIYNIGNDSFVAITGINEGSTGAMNYGHYRIYSLPGTIPCSTCNSSSLGMGRVANGNSDATIKVEPNPANNTTNIYYAISGGVNSGTIVIIDMTGKIVDSYKVNSGNSYITVSTANLASGTYYCTLKGNSIHAVTQKLVVIH